MRRGILIALLSLGTLGGFASGAWSLKHRSCAGARWHEPASAPAHAHGDCERWQNRR